MIEENNNDRIISAEDLPEEKVLEQTLRPKRFEDYIGQEKIKENLKVFIEAAKKRNEVLEHVLLYGNPGLGKTTLAYIIAQEMGAGIKITSGPAIEKAGDLAAILTNLQEGDVLFIDEIHRLNKQIEEVLYPAMEDFCLDIIIGKGPSAKTLRLDLPKFTMIGATTKIGLISSPLRDRFGATFRLEFYNQGEIEKIVSRNAGILKTEIETSAATEIAKRSRSTPRVANRILKRVRDFAEVKGNGTINKELTDAALKALEIDNLGLDNVDRKIIQTIIEKFAGGPVGLNTLAAATSEEMDTIEDIYEPFLIQLGFLERTPRGRKVTALCYEHLCLVKPVDGQEPLL